MVIMVSAAELTSTVMLTLFWMFGVFIAGLLLFIVFHVSRFKIRVRCRKKINGRTVIKDVKAREFTKEGVKYWQLLSRVNGRKNVQVPSNEVIDITEKGKIVAEAFVNSTGEFSWINSNLEEGKNIPVCKKGDEVMDSGSGSFHAFTTEDRIVMMHEFEKADAKKGKDMKELLMTLGPMSILGLVVIMAIVFSADIADSIVTVIDKVDAVMTHADQVLKRADQVSSGRQEMEPAIDGGPPG